MTTTPDKILRDALQNAQFFNMSVLENDWVKDLSIIIQCAENQKAVLGVLLTSITYKIYQPQQDIRLHQENMPDGYSGRTFDTKYITPFLKQHFSHYAMAESAWLTRSLEQPHPYTLNFPGKIRNRYLKAAFLRTLDHLQSHPHLANDILQALFFLMLENRESEKPPEVVAQSQSAGIISITEAINQHIHYKYKGVTGTARLPVLALYAVYRLLVSDMKRYERKILAPLKAHTSADIRSGAFGDIEIYNEDGSCFEAIEIKFEKPVTPDIVQTAVAKIRRSKIERYYILTTNNPNTTSSESIALIVEQCKKELSCQIIINGVIPSLKYYLRLVTQPENFIGEYTQLLQTEYQLASGVKILHLNTWQEILTRAFS